MNPPGVFNFGFMLRITDWIDPFGLTGLTIHKFAFEFMISITGGGIPKRMCANIDATIGTMNFAAHAFMDIMTGEFSFGMLIFKSYNLSLVVCSTKRLKKYTFF